MPRKYNTRKRSRANSFTRRVRPRNARSMFARKSLRRGRGRISAVRRTLPDFTMVALKYQNIIPGFTLNSLPQTTRQWRLNSLYDPNYTVTNPGQHQPYGYDQYAVFFQKYRVFSTKVRFEFMNPTNGASQGAIPDRDLMVAMWPGPDPTTSLPGSNMNIIGEAAKATHKVLSRKNGSSKRQVLTGFYRMNKLLGVSKKEYNTDQNFEAFSGNNPATTPLLNVLAYNPHNTSDTGTYDLKINLTYYASMFRKRMPDMS